MAEIIHIVRLQWMADNGERDNETSSTLLAGEMLRSTDFSLKTGNSTIAVKPKNGIIRSAVVK